ncbi:MAG: SRPBCC domain-containing protein [Kouleothrix sp.]
MVAEGHSRSGDPRTTVLLERYVGGRLYERTPNGVEYVWGVVLVWEPPQRFAYHWHLGGGPAQPTRVDVSFTALDSAQTRVEVLHRGPELIGERWWQSGRVSTQPGSMCCRLSGSLCHRTIRAD